MEVEIVELSLEGVVGPLIHFHAEWEPLQRSDGGVDTRWLSVMFSIDSPEDGIVSFTVTNLVPGDPGRPAAANGKVDVVQALWSLTPDCETVVLADCVVLVPWQYWSDDSDNQKNWWYGNYWWYWHYYWWNGYEWHPWYNWYWGWDHWNYWWGWSWEW